MTIKYFLRAQKVWINTAVREVSCKVRKVGQVQFRKVLVLYTQEFRLSLGQQGVMEGFKPRNDMPKCIY
jgi:hypothetical protein